MTSGATTISEHPPSANAYTDAPRLHPHWLLGSLQLFAWLFLHPSAWRSHISRIDPALAPYFCLADLNRVQWRRRSLWRVLLGGYLLLPVLAGLTTSAMLWMFGRLGAGAPVGVALGVAIGLALGLVVNVASGIVTATIASMALTVIFGTRGVILLDVMLGASFGTAFGLTGGLAGFVTTQVSRRKQTSSVARQFGGIVAGILIGSGALVAVAGINVLFAVVWQQGLINSPLLASGTGILFGGLIGIAVGLRSRRWRRGAQLGAVSGLAIGVSSALIMSRISLDRDASDLGLLIPVVFVVAATFIVLFTLPYVLAERVAGQTAGAVAGVLASQGAHIFTGLMIELYAIWPNLSLSLILGLLGLGLPRWLPFLLYPFEALWNTLLYRLEEEWRVTNHALLRWHSAFWDEHQRLQLAGLDDHVVLIMERNPAEGRAALDYLSASRQRWAAQAAQIELDARELERCADVEAIAHSHPRLIGSELEGPASALLRSFGRLSSDAAAALQQTSAYHQRLTLQAVEEHIDGLIRELTRSQEPYAMRFQPIAVQWRRIVADRARALTLEVELRQEIDNPYVIGVPLTDQEDIFVGRADIAARIEALLMDRRRPPLLLYGQRRIGKTSLLHNLGRLLPDSIVPIFVDLQGPVSTASDHPGLFYNLARAMADSVSRRRNLSLPRLTRESLAADPFTRFDEWLDEMEEALGASGRNVILLALDEFEALDVMFAQGYFSEAAVLGTLRHLIQHRLRFKVLLAGSHTLDEFQQWSGYLINAQVVRINYLTEAETRRLVEHPVKDYRLDYTPEAVQHVLGLTRGHPFLVQLLCSEIVTLKNEQAPAVRRLARLADVEDAVPRALVSGGLFFADIERHQINDAALAVLRFMAAQKTRSPVRREALARVCPDGLDSTLAQLERRELIEPADDGDRFQVEMIRRWFARS